MPASDKRLWRLLIVLSLIAVPAATLRFACAGHTCDQDAVEVAAPIPFCSLPGGVRTLMVQGYRNERSPDAFAVTSKPAIIGQAPEVATGAALTWPSLASEEATRVPIVFMQMGGSERTGGKVEVPEDMSLADVSPTLAQMMGIEWAYPQYRDGVALAGSSSGAPPPLVVIVAWKGIGSADIEAAPKEARTLKAFIESGSGTLAASTGSLPVDSTAALTTVGAGTPPRHHGITGTWLRNAERDLVQAWSKGAPFSVVNELGDAMDADTRGEARVGLVATDSYDQGLVGGNWFSGVDSSWRDDDDVRIVAPSRVATTAAQVLATGYGQDATPDLLGVTLEGSVRSMDGATQKIASSASEASKGDALIVVVGTGSENAEAAPAGERTSLMPAAQITEAADTAAGAPVVESAIPGGLFLSRDAMAAEEVSTGTVVEAVKKLRVSGAPVMADAFPAFAISLERFCES